MNIFNFEQLSFYATTVLEWPKILKCIVTCWATIICILHFVKNVPEVFPFSITPILGKVQVVIMLRKSEPKEMREKMDIFFTILEKEKLQFLRREWHLLHGLKVLKSNFILGQSFHASEVI